MRQLCAAIGAALFLYSGPMAAQDVTLSAQDGGLSVSGMLRSFDGEFYTVDSEFGLLTLDGSGVTCTGPGCPNLDNYVAQLTIAGDRILGDTMVPLLLESFAAREGLSLRRIVSDDSNFHYVLWDTDSGTPQAEFSFHLGTTGQGFTDLFSDQADIVLAVREASREELKIADDLGLDGLKTAARGRVLALDGIVALMSRDNLVRDVSLPQLVAIRQGEVTRWSELGGVDEPIILHALLASHGVEEAAQAHLTPLGPVAVTRHQNLDSLSDAVARDPLALGLGTVSTVGNAAVLPLIGACGRGFEPSA
ncbi:MAG: substrate-binding domain-containing protein, partial [Pseudoruegeria sp.]